MRFATLGTQLDVGVETLEEEEEEGNVALVETEDDEIINVEDEAVNVGDVTDEFVEVKAELLVGL